MGIKGASEAERMIKEDSDQTLKQRRQILGGLMMWRRRRNANEHSIKPIQMNKIRNSKAKKEVELKKN